MKSLGAMIKQLHGLTGTSDLSDWESGFVQSVYDQSGQGTDTAFLSSKQAEKVNDLYTRHFGDNT